jgi:hypothetical protein
LAKTGYRFDSKLARLTLGRQIKPLAFANRFAKLGSGFEQLDGGLALLLGGSLRFGQDGDTDLLLDGRRFSGLDGGDGAVDCGHVC